jgi:hypothetical protein
MGKVGRGRRAPKAVARAHVGRLAIASHGATYDRPSDSYNADVVGRDMPAAR